MIVTLILIDSVYSFRTIRLILFNIWKIIFAVYVCCVIHQWVVCSWWVFNFLLFIKILLLKIMLIKHFFNGIFFLWSLSPSLSLSAICLRLHEIFVAFINFKTWLCCSICFFLSNLAFMRSCWERSCIHAISR